MFLKPRYSYQHNSSLYQWISIHLYHFTANCSPWLLQCHSLCSKILIRSLHQFLLTFLIVQKEFSYFVFVLNGSDLSELFYTMFNLGNSVAVSDFIESFKPFLSCFNVYDITFLCFNQHHKSAVSQGNFREAYNLPNLLVLITQGNLSFTGNLVLVTSDQAKF